MNKIIEFYDNEGKLFPSTIAEAVTVDNMPLNIALNKIKPSDFKQTVEEGFYITDANGNVAGKYTENGFDAVLSSAIENSIKDLIEYTPTVIEDDKNNIVASYKRLTDGGELTSPIVETVVHMKDVIVGSNEFYVYDNDNYIQDDYIKYSFTKPGITVTNILFNDHNIHITFDSTTAYDYVDAIIEYSPLTLNNYDTISISVSSPSITTESSIVPSFAAFKYNKTLALAITSDDLGVVELERNFAYLNGYATPDDVVYPAPNRGESFLVNTEDSTYTGNLYAGTHDPLTYTDDTGSVRRFTATSAVFGDQYGTVNYTKINGDDAKIMRKYRWSFAHHDASQASDLNAMIKEFERNSNAWEDYTGVGMKIMVEPNGDHNYLLAARESPEFCMSVFQNDTQEYGSYSVNVADWTSGKDITSFKRKPKGGFIRTFFQSHEQNFFENIVVNGAGKIVMGGTHGMGDALAYLKDIADNRDDIWVASTDEIWEYYHNYNNSKIVNVQHNNGSMSFDILVPKYAKHLFAGELTINLPLTDVTACTISNNNTIGGYRQNAEQFTINTGIETQIYSDINDLLRICRVANGKSTVRRDVQYLINILMDGDLKTIYQTALNNIGQ